MALFPQTKTIKPQFGYDTTPRENLKRTSAEAGNSFTRDAWGVARFTAKMEFVLTNQDASTLWTWWETNRPTAYFTFYDYDSLKHPKWQVGTGDGTAKTFIIPAKESTIYQVTGLNGVTNINYTLGADYTLGVGTGAEGEDQITFTVAPANGTKIYVELTKGRRRYTCEFVNTPTKRVVGHNRVAISMDIQQKFPIVGFG